MVTLNDAKQVTETIVKTCRPLGIIIFGSVAQKGKGNDLDLLIIVNDEKKTDRDIHLLIHSCLRRYYKHFTIDPFIIPLSTLKKFFAKGSPFIWLLLKEGRYLYMKDAVKEWLKQAEEELNMAVYLLEGGFFKGACYHAQQAIEKQIKAMLLNKGWELEKIHSVERLIALGEDYNIKLNISDKETIFIDSIYRSRYPGEAGLLPLSEPSKPEAQKAIDIAKKVKLLLEP